MAFRNLMDSVKNFFGPNNSFFNGPRAEEEAAYNPAPAASDSGYYAQPQQQAAPQQSANSPATSSRCRFVMARNSVDCP